MPAATTPQPTRRKVAASRTRVRDIGSKAIMPQANSWSAEPWPHALLPSAGSTLQPAPGLGARPRPAREGLPAAVEHDGPALHPDRTQHAVGRPRVLRQPLVDRVLGLRLDDPEHLAVALERAGEQDEAGVDEAVHVPRVLVPAHLLAHVARPVPRPAALQPDDVVRHPRSLWAPAGGTRIDGALAAAGRSQSPASVPRHSSSGDQPQPAGGR